MPEKYIDSDDSKAYTAQLAYIAQLRNLVSEMKLSLNMFTPTQRNTIAHMLAQYAGEWIVPNVPFNEDA